MADKFPGLGRGFIPPIRISDSYSSDSTDENKLFRNAETASTDSKGRLSVVPISASSCSDSVQSVLAEAASHMEIAELIAASQQEVQEQATEHVEALGHPASSSSSSSSNENSLMEIRAADTVSEEEQVLIYQRSLEQRWVRRRAASSSSTCSSSSSSSGYRSRSPLRAGRPMSIGDSGQSLSPPSSTDSSES